MLTLEGAIDAGIAGYRLLDHPFYRRWEAGTLARQELAAYAAQYRHVEARLPGFLADLADSLPPGAARDLVQRNLADELGDPVAHLELFDRFAGAVRAGAEPPSPATEELCRTYAEVLERGPVAALAGLLAYEQQAPEVATTKAAGLRCHYGVGAAGTLFWDHHGVVDTDHSAWTAGALRSLGADPEVVRSSGRAVARAWWRFLDEREAATQAA